MSSSDALALASVDLVLASPSTTTSGSVGQKTDRKRDSKDRFRYGNYNRYYGTRNKGLEYDPRINLFPAEWFRGRSVLDIGCNVGHLTLEIAKKLEPSHILGIDIDDHLVGVARKNIRHYCDGENKLIGKFPASIVSSSGDGSTFTALLNEQFPKNVWFLRENYVLESDEFLEMVREEYDVILALSITKWIHLNWGDEGLRRFLRRTYRQLRPGGRLLLEAQPFAKYYKKAKMTREMFGNYKGIQFKPHQFREYLLSDEVGFSECEELGAPEAISKGFERSIFVFKKTPRTLKTNKTNKANSKCENETGLDGLIKYA